MKERLLLLIRETSEPSAAGNLAREFLQARILLAIQESGAMIPLAFQRGTALRFVFDLPVSPRISISHSSVRNEGTSRSRRSTKRVKSHLEREGYEVVTTLRTARTVQSLMVAFPGLLHEAGLTPHASQRLNIRVKVDTKPPVGAGLETTIVRRHALLNIQHHDRPSLLAGKLHAILQRRWTKGRDLFDLFWYLSDSDHPQSERATSEHRYRPCDSTIKFSGAARR